MIIFSRTIEWLICKEKRSKPVTASVQMGNQNTWQVYVQIGQEGVCFYSPEEALAFGEAIVRAAQGKGIPGS